MFNFSLGHLFELIPQLLKFLPVTLTVTISAVLFGTLLGFLLAAAKLQTKVFIAWFATIYIFLIRSTPPIVLLFLVYYGLPKLLLITLNININDFYQSLFVIITFSLLFAANIAEVMRAAYLSISPSQREAGLCAGLTEFQTLRRIVLPQAAVIALPNFCNTVIIVLKDGSLAYIIGLMDILGAGENIIARNYGAHGLEVYIGAAIIYWGLVVLLEKGFSLLEKRLAVGRYDLSYITG